MIFKWVSLRFFARIIQFSLNFKMYRRLNFNGFYFPAIFRISKIWTKFAEVEGLYPHSQRSADNRLSFFMITSISDRTNMLRRLCVLIMSHTRPVWLSSWVIFYYTRLWTRIPLQSLNIEHWNLRVYFLR